METRGGKKYQEYAKLRNQVKNSVKKAKMSIIVYLSQWLCQNCSSFLMLLDVFHQALEICLGLYLAVT
jgi:hypothetical protein